MYLDKLKMQFQTNPLTSSNNTCSVTIAEMDILENKLAISLPEAYKEFLLWMGHYAGGLLEGSDCFYKDLFLLREDAIEILEENQVSYTLPDDAFVFFMHQGYQFAFLRTAEGKNPPVYYYNETLDNDYFVKTYDSFSEYLEDEFRAHLSYLESDSQYLLKNEKKSWEFMVPIQKKLWKLIGF